MSQLLKQCLCPTTWISIASVVDKINSESLFDSYFRRAYRNGWCYYRLYPKQYNYLFACEEAVCSARSIHPAQSPQRTTHQAARQRHQKYNAYRTQHVLCTQCEVKCNGFMQFSCDPSTCDLAKIRPHVINICHKCMQSDDHNQPRCFWNVSLGNKNTANY